MNTVVLWILVSTSYSGYNYGNTTVIANFKTQEACVKAEQQLPFYNPKKDGHIKSACVQAEVLVVK